MKNVIEEKWVVLGFVDEDGQHVTNKPLKCKLCYVQVFRDGEKYTESHVSVNSLPGKVVRGSEYMRTETIESI